MFKNNIIILSLFLLSCSTNISDNFSSNKINDIDISLKNKIAQMVMIRTNGDFLNKDNWMKGYIESLIKDHKIGGLITFGGSVHGTYYNLKHFQSLSDIPLFIAADYERGLGTFIDGTLFPPNMAISATGDSSLSYMQGSIISKEAQIVGVNMILAPVVDINNNLNNPIINIRSYGDTKETVIKFSIPFIKGIQDNDLISCAKHYPGHGNTSTDSHTSLPIIDISKEELYKNELMPFKVACDNNVGAIMVGHILIPEADAKNPATFSKKITHDILRKDWGYKGLIITDALEMGALTSTTWHEESAIRAVEAGSDIILLPLDGVSAINSIYNAVMQGRISKERIEESYNRIIKYKNKINLKEKNNFKWTDVETNIGIKANTKIAKNIAQKSITLVKNNDNLVPFIPYKYNKVTHILISTDNDLRLRMKSFVRDINYIHGNVNEIYVNDPLSDLALNDVLDKVKDSNIIIISMLIRISMDKGLSTIHPTHDLLLSKLKELSIPTIGISFGSPYLPNYDNLDSYLCAYGYGAVSFNAATNSLFGRSVISGKLPVSLNEEYKAGYGLTQKKNNKIFDSQINIDISESIKIIEDAISNKVFPGAQIFISKDRKIIFNEGIGNLSYDVNSKKVNSETIYDVASLTKVLATTPIIMKLIQKKKIGLNYPLSDFYPEFLIKEKEKITIKHLLAHTSGLKPYVEYYKKDGFDSKEKIINDILNLELDYTPGEKMVYSDLGMILLFDIIERTTNTSFENLAQKYYYNPLKMTNTFFNPKKDKIDMIAPTENDVYFRNEIVKGVVHDENAFLLGGVSGHAGLFSTAKDIGNFSQMLLNKGVFLGRRYLKKSIINKFTKRLNELEESDRTIGWDTPSQNGRSSAGNYFSKNTFGHLGFTGTSLWIDPNKNIIVVLLTNRVHPNRDNPKAMYDVRRNFHNMLIKKIGE